MSYYEFTVQIYGGEETAQEAYEAVRFFMDDEKMDYEMSVLWKMERVVIK